MPSKKFVYKNISKQEQALIGFGVVEAGKTIETDEEIRNANFERIDNDPKKTDTKKEEDSKPSYEKKEDNK